MLTLAILVLLAIGNPYALMDKLECCAKYNTTECVFVGRSWV